MAQKIQTLFIDDIDGGEADGTVRFSLDGTEYEIDLNARHTDELRTTLKSATAGRSGRRASSVDTVVVRAWAREHGYDIKDRGRVPADLVAKYEEAVR
jgi:hypothetical protein